MKKFIVGLMGSALVFAGQAQAALLPTDFATNGIDMSEYNTLAAAVIVALLGILVYRKIHGGVTKS
jgi:hypothetical protein